MSVAAVAPLTTPVPVLVRRRRGRPPTVDRTRIAEAVLDVGFGGLTYAAVGERLRVSLATLFRHVRGRDELSRLGLDLAVRRHAWPGLDGPWRDVLEQWAVATWQLWAQYPGAATEVSRGVVPPAVVQLSDQVSAALLHAGFTPGNAVRAVDLVFDLATDSRRGADAFDEAGSDDDGTMRQLVEAQWRTAALDDLVPFAESVAIRSAMDDAIRADPFAWFTGKLQVVLSGIEAELAPEARVLAG